MNSIINPRSVRVNTQLLRIMKLIAVLVLLCCLRLSAATYAQTITLIAKNSSLKDVFNDIQKQTDYNVIYNERFLDKVKPVNVSVKQMPLEEFLSLTLTERGLSYSIREKTILIGLTKSSEKGVSSLKFQLKSVTGKVISDTGEPLVGVSVKVEGSSGATITNVEGNYKINIQPNQTILVFSYLGFEPVKKNIEGQSVINVTMKTAASALNEVVVIGYETISRKDLTGSVSSVQAKDLKDITVISAEQALTGRIAGVQVTASEGSLDPDVNIVVRGGGSITQDNSPLYIIDGVQVEDGLRSISPQDIQSIDVLKDASATAIYGSRGANGVVVVTTKSGKAGRSAVEYYGHAGLNQLPSTLPVMSPYEFVLYQWERYSLSNDSNGFKRIYKVPTFSFSHLEQFKQYQPVDWQREVMGNNGWQQTHNVSVNGGTTATKYNLSYTYNDATGIVINTDYARHLFNFKLDQTISPKLKVGVSSRHSFVTNNGAGTSDAGNAQLNGIRNFIKYKPYLNEGEAVDEFDEDYFDDTNQGGGLGLLNPIAWSLAKYRKSNNTTTNLGANLTYSISRDWSFKSSGGYNSVAVNVDQFNDALRSIQFPSTAVNTSQNKTFNLSNVVTYSNSKSSTEFSKKNAITILLGEETYTRELNSDQMQFMNYPRGISPETALSQFTQGQIRPGFPNSNYEKSTLLSFFGRANYTYSNKYLFAFTMRADGSSKFAPGNRWGYFPSGSFAWRITRERFMEDINWLQDLKLRLSYGTSGNNRIPDYYFMSSFNANAPYALGNDLSVFGYQSSTLPNPGLKWETTVVQNLGLDFSVLKNRLQVTLDVYSNRTNDVITSVPISTTTGYSRQLQNTADTRNSGVEVQFSSQLIKRNKFSWNADFNISYNNNIVKRLSSGLESYIQSSGWVSLTVPGDYIVKVGEPVGSIWGFVSDGLYSVDDFDYDPATTRYTLKSGVVNSTAMFGAPQPGSMKVKDISGNGIIGEDDKQIIGHGNPKFYGGLNQQFTFGNFDASIFINYRFKSDVLNANKIEISNGYLNNNNLPSEFENRWKIVDATGEVVQRLSGSTITGAPPEVLRELNKDANMWIPVRSTPGYYTTSWAVEDGSFVRINNVTVGYSFSPAMLTKLNIKRARIYATGNNLAVFTKYSGYDPEVNTRRSTGVTPGVDYSAYPRSRNLTLGVNLTL